MHLTGREGEGRSRGTGITVMCGVMNKMTLLSGNISSVFTYFVRRVVLFRFRMCEDVIWCWCGSHLAYCADIILAHFHLNLCDEIRERYAVCLILDHITIS